MDLIIIIALIAIGGFVYFDGRRKINNLEAERDEARKQLAEQINKTKLQ